MRAHDNWIGPLIAVAAITVVASAAVPITSYLTPDRFAANRGEEIKLHVEAGAALVTAATPWPGEKLGWFFVRGDGTQENRDNIQPADAQRNQEVAVRIAQPGVTKIGFDAKPAVTTLTGEELQAFLQTNVAGATENPAVRRLAGSKAVRVRRYECALTLVRVPVADGKSEHSAVATSKTGQIVEVQPMFDPTMLTVGSDLPVRVYIRGSAQSGMKVQATNIGARAQATKVTDSVGSTYFSITQTGVWRVEFHQAEALENDAQADWTIYSATLTFEVPKGAATENVAPAPKGAGK